MIRYPLIESCLQRSVWCASPDVAHAIWQALRRARPVATTLPADAIGNAARPTASRVSLASGGLATVSLSEPSAELSVAVIPVHGIIGKYMSEMEMDCGGGYDLQAFERSIQKAAADPSIGSIVLHINSPGGVITGVSEAAQLVAQINDSIKPVYAYTDSDMCSAAYWLGASGAGVFCSEMASVASIGVYLAWIDDSEAMAEAGFKLMLFRDGDLKAATLPGQLSDEAGQLLQDEVVAIGTAFRTWVRERRAANDAQVPDSAMRGQAMLGSEALKVGLVDGHYRSLNDLLLDILINQKGTP